MDNERQRKATKGNIMARRHNMDTDIPQAQIITLGVRDLANIFSCSEATIRTIRSRTPEKLPPAIVIGRKQLWLQETVRTWLLDRQEGQHEKSETGGAE